MELFLNEKLGKITLEISKPFTPKATLILAHGAGAGMNHAFMKDLSLLLTNQDIRVVRFNFPYMEQGRKSPGSANSNISCWQLVYSYIQAEFDGLPLFISGKSYGGRMASHLLAETEDLKVKGIIYFGFPLHAPGKDSTERASHLQAITQPQLFLQGAKDKLANVDLIKEVTNDLPNASLKVFEYADHSFHVPKKSGKTDEEILEQLSDEAAKWIFQL